MKRASGRWDQDFAALQRSVLAMQSAITKFVAIRAVRELESLQRDARAIRVRLVSAVERVREINRRSRSSASQERALVYWSSVVAERLADVARQTSRHFSGVLWTRLIQARLSGIHVGKGENLDEIELIDMGIQKMQLEKTASHLKENIIALHRQKATLLEEVQAHKAAVENALAAGSLSARLGPTLETSLRSPTMQALSYYVRNLARPVAEKSDPAVHASRERLQRAQWDAWEISKQLVLASLHSKQDTHHTGTVAGTAPSTATRAQLEARLREIRELEKKAARDPQKQARMLVAKTQTGGAAT